MCTTADTASTRNISKFCNVLRILHTAGTFGLAVCRDSLLPRLWILPVVLQVFRDSVLRVVRVRAVFRSSVVFVLPVLAVSKNCQ